MRDAGFGSRRIKVTLVFTLLLCVHAFAAPKTLPDYGPALALFQSFGFDAVPPGGQYATLSLPDRSTGDLQPIANLYQIPFSEKGWVWPGEKGQPSRYLFLGGLGGTCPFQGASPTDEPDETVPLATWNTRDADLAKDIADVLRILKKPASTADEEENTEKDSSDFLRDQFSQGEANGALLLAAAHLYQAGLKDEANEIADLLFQLANERAIVVRNAVMILAQTQYSAAGARLASTRDWRAYREDLAGILDRFGLAWDKAPGLEFLIQKVDQRIAGNPPEGDGIDEAAARFFAEISPDSGQLLNQLKLAVIINPAVQLALLSSPERDSTDCFLARGIHMLPALLAVVDSDDLLPAALEIPSPYRNHSYHYSRQNEKTLKSAEEIYAELENKPPCLGDTALALLALLCPQPESPSREEDKSNTVQRVRAFYAAHAADSPVKLATTYLEQGNDDQRASALAILLQAMDTNVLAIAESHLLSSNVWSRKPYSLLDSSIVMQIQAYASQHPERAALFLPDFLAKLKEQLPDRLSKLEPSRRDRETQRSKQLLRGLEQALHASQGKELKEAASDPADDLFLSMSKVQSSLMKKTEDMPPREATGLFLDEIVAQNGVAQRQALLMTLMSLYQYRWDPKNAEQDRREVHLYQRAQELSARFDEALFQDPNYVALIAARAPKIRETAAQESDSKESPTNASAQPGSKKIFLLDFVDQWTVLLADTRPPTPEQSAYFQQMGESSKATVSDTAAQVLASVALNLVHLSPERQKEVNSLRSRIYPFWHQVARAALAGTPPHELPPLPNAEQADPETVSSLVKQISSASPDQQLRLIRETDLNSLLALGQVATTNKPFRKALLPAANRIDSIHHESEPTLAARLEPFVGTALSTNLFLDLLQLATSLATQSVAATISLHREPWLGGTSLSVFTNREGRFSGGGYDPFGNRLNGTQASIFAACQSQNIHDYAIWEVPLPTSKTTTPSNAPSSEPDVHKLMSQLGISIEDSDLSPDMLARMAEAMSKAQSSEPARCPEGQDKLIQSIDQFSSGAKSPLMELRISFQIILPKPEGDNANREPDMELDPEEMIIE